MKFGRARKSTGDIQFALHQRRAGYDVLVAFGKTREELQNIVSAMKPGLAKSYYILDVNKKASEQAEYKRARPATRNNPPRTSKSSPNEYNVRELFLYITNDGDLYRQRVQPIIKNLRLKVAKGKYDHALAIKIYQYLADDGARKYLKENGTTGDRVDSVFSKVDRTQCAKELRDYYDDEVRG